MVSGSRFILNVAALVVLLGGLRGKQQWGLTGSGRGSMWNLLDPFRQLIASEKESAELDEKSTMLLARIELRQRILRELAAGRTTLLEAAAGYQSLDEGLPFQHPVYLLPGATLEEQKCRQVIAHLRAHMRSCPEDFAPGLAERLERELLDRLAAPGGLHFSPVGQELPVF